MPIPLVQDQPTEANYVGLQDRLPVTTAESVKTTFTDELFNNAVTSKIVNYNRKKELEAQDGKELSVDELKQKYDGLGLTWDGPKKEQVAEFIADKQRERIYNQKKIEAGPDDYLSGGLRMGAGIAAHIVDPTELALTAGTAGLFKVGLAARFGAAALAEAGFAAKIGIGAAEGAITQVALEPAEYAYDKQFQRDYDTTEAFKRVAYGAAMGGLMEGTIHAGQKLIERMRGTKAHALAHDVALSQVADGNPVNVDPIIHQFEAERMPHTPEGVKDFSGRVNYEFRDFNPESPGGTKIYIGSQSAHENFSNLDLMAHGKEGFVDHPLVANADAAGSFNEVTGNVYELTLSPDAKIVSTSQPLGENGTALLLTALKKASQDGSPGEGMIRALLREYNKGNIEFNTLNDVLQAGKKLGMNDSVIFKSLEPNLEAAGFHGMHIVDSERGINRFEFFNNALKNNGVDGDKKLFMEANPLAGDEKLVNRLSPQEQMDLRKAKDEYVPAIERQNQEFGTQAEAKGTFATGEFETHVDESINEITQRISSFKEDPEFKDVIDHVAQLDAEFAKVEKQQDFLSKAAMKCVGLNG